MSLNYINTRTHGFFVNASGLVLGGKYVSFNATHEANATTVFFGTKPTVIGFDVLPFQFNGAESATRTPLVQVRAS